MDKKLKKRLKREEKLTKTAKRAKRVKKVKSKPKIRSEKISIPSSPPTFKIDDEKQRIELKNYFEENGYAVVQLNEIRGLEDKFWDWLRGLGTGLPVSFPKTVKEVGEYRKKLPGNLSNGIINGKEKSGTGEGSSVVVRTGIGQSNFCWSVRGDPQVRQVFECLLETKDLRVSFDSANIFFGKIQKATKMWWHVDQQSSSNLSIQGLYNARACTEKSGGFLCYPKSHKHHPEIIARAKPRKNQEFILMKPTEPILSSSQPILVCTPPHCLTLWDSRVIHCNTTGKDWNKWATPTDPIHRLVVYVCMCEASKVSLDTDRTRINMYLRGGTTNHSPVLMTEKTSPRWPRKNFCLNLDESNPGRSPVTLNRSQLEVLADKSLWDMIPSHLKLLD